MSFKHYLLKKCTHAGVLAFRYGHSRNYNLNIGWFERTQGATSIKSIKFTKPRGKCYRRMVRKGLI